MPEERIQEASVPAWVDDEGNEHTIMAFPSLLLQHGKNYVEALIMGRPGRMESEVEQLRTLLDKMDDVRESRYG